MSKLRPECGNGHSGEALPDDTALYLIRDSVAKRRALIHGKLHDGRGKHCAIGAFFNDNPRVLISTALVDEVAAVNDSVPKSASAAERWKKVNAWLKWKIACLTGASQ